MMRLIRTEILKVRTTRVVPLVMAIAPLIAALATWDIVGHAGIRGAPSLGTAEHVRRLLSIPGLAAAPLMLVGILLTAGENRHGTITRTFLTTPVRSRVVVAKATAAALIGLSVAVVTALVVAVIAVPWEAQLGVDLPAMLTTTMAVNFAAGIVVVTLYALLGAGIGALVSNQVAAAIGALAWFFYVEPNVVAAALPDLARWLPTGVTAAATGGLHAPTGVPVWIALLVLVAWVGAVTTAGGLATVRRDI